VTKKNPTIDLETNSVLTLHYDGTDINGLVRRTATRDWWDAYHFIAEGQRD